MRTTLKEIVFDVIKNSNKITKTQIKNSNTSINYTSDDVSKFNFDQHFNN